GSGKSPKKVVEALLRMQSPDGEDDAVRLPVGLIAPLSHGVWDDDEALCRHMRFKPIRNVVSLHNRCACHAIDGAAQPIPFAADDVVRRVYALGQIIGMLVFA